MGHTAADYRHGAGTGTGTGTGSAARCDGGGAYSGAELTASDGAASDGAASDGAASDGAAARLLRRRLARGERALLAQRRGKGCVTGMEGGDGVMGCVWWGGRGTRSAHAQAATGALG